MNTKLTIDEKIALCEEYQNSQIPTKSIAEKYGISESAVSYIAIKMGATRRRPKRTSYIAKVCPKCKQTIMVEGAKFCYRCGADIRTNKELLIARIEASLPNILHMPQNMRDDMQRLLIDIIAELKK